MDPLGGNSAANEFSNTGKTATGTYRREGIPLSDDRCAPITGR
jgi:hypothetical protein